MLTNQIKKSIQAQAIKHLRSKSSGVASGMNKGYSALNTGFRASVVLNKPQAVDNFVNGTSAVYVDYVYEQWKANPASVHASWRAYFDGIENNSAEPFQAPPTLGQQNRDTLSVQEIMNVLSERNSGGVASIDATSKQQAQKDAFKVNQLIRGFAVHGHYKADLDPLKMSEALDEVVIN